MKFIPAKIVLLVVCVLSTAAPAQAQYWYNPAFDPALSGLAPGTAAANYLMGVSQVIRAEGEYNLSTSEAYMNYEDARTRYIENKKLWTRTYFAMREQNEARRSEALRRAKYSPETLAAAAHSGVPKPLGHEVLDPLTGTIQWPELLLDERFDAHRHKIEELLAVRLATYGSGSRWQIASATREMIETLKATIHELPVDDYIAARKFLDRLAVSG